jgi:hypothetical protein
MTGGSRDIFYTSEIFIYRKSTFDLLLLCIFVVVTKKVKVNLSLCLTY